MMTPVQRDLPSGTVTFLFTDVEGSTKLLHELGPDAYADALAEHRRVLRDAFVAHGGVEVDTQGDAFFVAFPTAPGALQASAQAVEGLVTSGPIRVRMGLHTGTPHLAEDGYVGADVHRAARIAACAHGSQVLISSSTAALLDSGGLRDLGEHRLKDLSAPERIYQFGDTDFPPLKSLHQTNLPVPATPFLGRERELTEVGTLLARDDVRAVTLTGAGGTGKTRLALQAAGVAADAFADGVWWVPLAPLRDPGLVIEAAADALGATGELGEHIGQKRLLLLLDNFEQVVSAAPDVAQLLARCRRLTVLVTSREPLRIDGEWEYAVDPMQEAEAVALFEMRARAARRDFTANGEVREICARLDNLPLAIELAAARVKVLSAAALLERLKRRLPALSAGPRDAPERQRTLSAMIAWSHELLTTEEQILFRRLGVFVGGATLDAIEAVCDTDLDLLASLVDKSLVRMRDGERYWMLETIREYALDRLDELHEAEEIRRRHAEHFLALAEDAEPHLRDGSREWLELLDRDHDNLRVALDQLEACGDVKRVLRLAGAVSWLWHWRYLAEGRRRLESALLADTGPVAARAKALNGAAQLAMNAGDVAAARVRAEEAVALHGAGDDRWGRAYSVFLLGWATHDSGDPRAAQPLLEESVRLFAELDDERLGLFASHVLAWSCYSVGQRERARALWEDSLRRARAVANRYLEALSLGALADNVAVEEGRLDDALLMLTEAYRINRELGTPEVQAAMDLGRLARGLALAGRSAAAVRILACAQALYEEIGAQPRQVFLEKNEQTRRLVSAKLDDSTFAEAWEQGRALSPDEAVDLAFETRE